MSSEQAPPADVHIASVMICDAPRIAGQRRILSASDGVWEPVSPLPSAISALVTDELGNLSPNYGGFVQVADHRVLDEIEGRGFFCCFRAVHEPYLEHVQTVPNSGLYSELKDKLIHVGWDVCTGNGWVSASLEGDFPINPFTGVSGDATLVLANSWGLFETLPDAMECQALNEVCIPDRTPWYPVSISVDPSSYHRLCMLPLS